MQMAALYESITRSIIDDLEKGVPAWVQPWRTKRRTALGLLPANFATGRTYSGINIPILWHAAKSAGYPDPAWMTYRQALELDANVRKGEKGTHIVFTRKLTIKKEEDEDTISMLRSYTVFNVAQIDGLPPTIVTPRTHRRCSTTPRSVSLRRPAPIFVTGAAARASFHRSTSSNYRSTRISATALHELGHWSGHETRLIAT